METRICRLTQQPFEISAIERDAYLSFSLPLPDVCVEERTRQKLAFRNESQLFWRRCDLTGGRLYSAYDPTAPFPVVPEEYWWNGDWDALEQGVEFNSSIPFFELLFSLWVKVPRPALSTQKSFSSHSSHNVRGSSNCFMAFDVYHSDNCYNLVAARDSRFCADCLNVSSCEFCYECTNCYFCKRIRFSEHCYDCHESWFLSNCTHCTNCLFCTNLDSKDYHIFNQPVSAAEFESAVSAYRMHTVLGLELAKEAFAEFLKDKPVPHLYAARSSQVSGNYLYHCANAVDSFECSECDTIVNCQRLARATNCLEGIGFGSGLGNSTHFVSVGGNAKNILSCVDCWNDIEDLAYCAFCERSSNLFGCVGLRGKEFCILNKQYGEAQYRSLMEIIIGVLKGQGVWGQFFPGPLSGHAYNRSAAGTYMPLNSYQAAMLNYRWDDSDDVIRPSLLLGSEEGRPEVIFAESPASIDDLPSDGADEKLYLCELSGRPFRYVAGEIKLYRELKVAPPTRIAEQRYRERLHKLAPRRVLERELEPGKLPVKTAFPSNWPRPVMEFSK